MHHATTRKPQGATLFLIAALSVGLMPEAKAAPSPAPKPAPTALKPISVSTDILFGLHPGMDLDDAREALRRVGSSHSDPQNKDLPPKEGTKKAAPQAGRDEDEGEGHTELWTLRGTPFAQVVLKAEPSGQVLWITAVLRPDQALAFTRFGAAPRALVFRDSLAVWNVLTPTQPPYRLIARGDHGRARVLSLISLAPHRP